jgi:hypothetical protein
MNEHIHEGVFVAQRRLPESGHQYHCRPNRARTRQSRPDPGRGFQVFSTPFELFPLRAKAVTQKRGCAARAGLPERSTTPMWSMTHFDVFLKANSPRFVGKLTSKVNSRSEYATKILLVL